MFENAWIDISMVIWSFLQSENAFSIVMQYAEGGTMDRMISEQKGIKFAENTVLNYFTQVNFC